MDDVSVMPTRVCCSRLTNHGIVNVCILEVSDCRSGVPTHFGHGWRDLREVGDDRIIGDVTRDPPVGDGKGERARGLLLGCAGRDG